VECRGNNQATNCQCEETCRSLSDNDVEILFKPVQAAKEEAHSHDQQQIREHASNERRLDDDDLTVD